MTKHRGAREHVGRVESHVIVGGKMGYRKPLDLNSIQHQIYMTGVEIMSERNDGFTQWELKKDLYVLQGLINSIIERSPTFVDEEEYLRELEQNRVVRILER